MREEVREGLCRRDPLTPGEEAGRRAVGSAVGLQGGMHVGLFQEEGPADPS